MELLVLTTTSKSVLAKVVLELGEIGKVTVSGIVISIPVATSILKSTVSAKVEGEKSAPPARHANNNIRLLERERERERESYFGGMLSQRPW